MDRLHHAIKNVHRLDDLAARDTFLTRLDPTAKLLAVLVYLAVTLSFGRYALTGLLGMGLFPILLYEIDDLSLVATLRQARPVVVLLAAVGVFNLFFDRAPRLTLGPLVLSGGWVSLLTLVVKGVFCFLAVYLLIATTGMERICDALRRLHVPRVLVTTILLTYRYIILLLQEANRISTAYALRAPGQKGIAFKAWGSLLGQLLLRSIDRARVVYESMLLRGYGYSPAPLCEGGGPAGPEGEKSATDRSVSGHGEVLSPTRLRAGLLRSRPPLSLRDISPHSGESPSQRGPRSSAAFLVITILYCILFRTVPVFELIGRLF